MNILDNEGHDPNGLLNRVLSRTDANDLATAQAENKRLREIVMAPLSPAELKLVDKHCGWIAFKHAWNAVMKRRQEAIANEQSPSTRDKLSEK